MRAVAALPLFLALAACAGTAERTQAPIPAASACAPPIAPERGEAPLPGFGCSTLANLQAMAADPRDLVSGRAETPPRGDAAIAAAHRHRVGAIKTPKADAVQPPSLVVQNQGAPQ